MAANIAEIRAKVAPRIKDSDNRLTVTPPMECDVDRAITSAREQYEKTRPREVTLKVPGTAAFDYLVSGFTGFVDGFSTLAGVAYPYVASAQGLTELEDVEFGLVRLDTGLVLRFTTARPAATEFFLVAFTAPHTLNASTSTIRASDDEALADLAAANCCDMLAALYAKDVDSSIAADSVDRRTKSDNYRSMAASYRKSYSIKVSTGDTQAAAVAMTDIDRQGFGHRGRQDYFFHGWRTH